MVSVPPTLNVTLIGSPLAGALVALKVKVTGSKLSQEGKAPPPGKVTVTGAAPAPLAAANN